MGPFDFPSSAALSQLKNEAISTSPIDRTASRIAGVDAKILELAGFIGVGNLTDLILELKNLAANKDKANITAKRCFVSFVNLTNAFAGVTVVITP